MCFLGYFEGACGDTLVVFRMFFTLSERWLFLFRRAGEKGASRLGFICCVVCGWGGGLGLSWKCVYVRVLVSGYIHM